MWERASSGEHGSERLAARRSRHHRRMFISFGILFVIFSAALVYGLWQKSVRVSTVVMYGADQSLASIATSAMQGTFFGVPRDSIFFVPEESIRSGIMGAHPDIAAVSIFRNGLNGLSIKVDYRVPIARWCGVAPAASAASSTEPISGGSSCYFFDANGFTYATSSQATPVNTFAVYEPIGTGVASSSSETNVRVGMILPNAVEFPTVFDFARQLATFGSSVATIVIHDDRTIDFYCKNGTRITYMLGDEQNAYTALSSASTHIDVAKGSVEYVDLRFPGKIYVKAKGSSN